jgi:hypothetical protein
MFSIGEFSRIILKNISDALDNIIMVEWEVKMNFTSSQFDVEEKDVDDVLAGICLYCLSFDQTLFKI